MWIIQIQFRRIAAIAGGFNHIYDNLGLGRTPSPPGTTTFTEKKCAWIGHQLRGRRADDENELAHIEECADSAHSESGDGIFPQ